MAGEDGVLKEIFQKEEEARLLWEKKWGFLRNMDKLRLEEANRRGISFSLPCKVPEEEAQSIKVGSNNKVPATSSGMIGWRSSNPENDYNRLVGPLHISAKLFKCPPRSKDEPDPKKQKCIFLG